MAISPAGYGFYNIYNQPTGQYLGVPPGTIAPATPAGYTQAYGGIPQVPDPRTTTGEAIGANQALLPQLEGLAGAINPFQQQQLLGQYRAAIPNYDALQAASSGNISSDLAGTVPQDVINQLVQQAAERGIATGSPGSPNANAAYLRALGLTSLGLKSQGQQELTAAMGRAPVAQPFDLTKLMLSPDELFSARQLANLYASAPVPAAAATAGIGAFKSGALAGYRSGSGGVQLSGGAPYQPIQRPTAPGGYGGYSAPVTPYDYGADQTALEPPPSLDWLPYNIESGVGYSGIPTGPYQTPLEVSGMTPAGFGPYADQPSGDYAQMLQSPFLNPSSPFYVGDTTDYYGDAGGD